MQPEKIGTRGYSRSAPIPRTDRNWAGLRQNLRVTRPGTRYRPARHLRVSHKSLFPLHLLSPHNTAAAIGNEPSCASLLPSPCCGRPRSAGLCCANLPIAARRAQTGVPGSHSALRSPTSRCNCSISDLRISYSAILRWRNCTAMVALRSIPRGVSRYA